MLESSLLEDLIEQNSGIVLHRKRVLTAFSHLREGPLLDVLFKLTRPPLRKASTVAATLAARAAKAAQAPIEQVTTIVQTGMVDHRRERHPSSVAPQTDF